MCFVILSEYLIHAAGDIHCDLCSFCLSAYVKHTKDKRKSHLTAIKNAESLDFHNYVRGSIIEETE